MKSAQRLARQHPAPRHEHVVIAVDQNVFNGRVGQQVFQGPKARQFLGERLGNLAHFAFVDRHAAQAHEAGHFDVNEFLDRRTRPAASSALQRPWQSRPPSLLRRCPLHRRPSGRRQHARRPRLRHVRPAGRRPPAGLLVPPSRRRS